MHKRHEPYAEREDGSSGLQGESFWYFLSWKGTYMAQKLKYTTCEQMSTGTWDKKDNLINLLPDIAST